MDSIEFLSDRANPHIDPVLSIWEWQIPVYLFLGGLVAGIMIIGAAQELLWPKKWDRKLSVICAIAAAAALSIGMLALLLDLSHKLYVFRFYMAFKPLSPMSWGSWILIFVYPLFVLWLLGSLDEIQVFNYALDTQEIAALYNEVFDRAFCLGLSDEAKAADLNGDCQVNLADFADIARDWLNCGLYPESGCNL